jgi:hypothetical protein
LKEARETGRTDYQRFIKSIYTSYIGRMETDWPRGFQEHEQPAWAATIRADTRSRACRYAARIAAEHGLHPVAANVDSWTYRVPEGADVTVFNDPDMTSNGKYEIEEIQAGPNGEGPSTESLQQLAKTFHGAGRTQEAIAAMLGVDATALDGWLR